MDKVVAYYGTFFRTIKVYKKWKEADEYHNMVINSETEVRNLFPIAKSFVSASLTYVFQEILQTQCGISLEMQYMVMYLIR